MFAAGKTAGVSAGGGGSTDPQFNYVTMLLHGDGTNGAQNNTFLDSSTNNYTITRNGNTTQGSFSPYGSNWSNTFIAGSGIKFAPSSAYAFGTGAFTGECWLNIGVVPPAAESIGNPSTGGGQMTLFGWGANDGSLADWRTFFCITSSTGASWDRAHLRSNQNDGKNNVFNSLSSPLVVGTWYHIAFVRPSSISANLNVYINGVFNCALDITNADFYFGGSATVETVGWTGIESFEYSTRGYISNARSVVGVAVYTSNFTPSTTPLTAVSGTSVLTCQSNRFKDNSTNNFAVTAVLTPTVQRFNPFGTATAYSTSVFGGSGFFPSGSSQGSSSVRPLAVPNNSAFNLTGDFTVELWHYGAFPANSGNNVVFLGSDYSAGLNQQIALNAECTRMGVYHPSTGFQTSSVVSGIVGSWNYYAYVRSGSTVTFYFNGVNVGTVSNSQTFTMQNGAFGALGGYGGAPAGYITDFRVSNGTVRYTSNFTPPTAPLTAPSGTTCLLSMTNGAIFDNAMINDLETQGNAQISTSVYKYGTGSLYFDGSGDRLNIATKPPLNITGDFTIEMWVYMLDLPSYSILLDISADGQAGSGMTEIWIQSNGSATYYARGTILMTSASSLITTNAWYHIAVVKSGTSQVLYINGTNRASTTSSTQPGFDLPYWIGDRPASAGSGQYPLNGYIDDFRITNGYARYTANFTPPTSAFLNIGPN